MKNEWATVKDSILYVGSHGTEFVSADGTVDRSLMWVKTIDKYGNVQHLDWTDNYKKVMEAVKIYSPGYLTHEAVEWCNKSNRWFFLPRKASTEAYDWSKDDQKATNLLLSATPDFSEIKVNKIII